MSSTRDIQDRYMIVASDSHAGADKLGYRNYLEKKWHEDFGAWASTFEDAWGKHNADAKNKYGASTIANTLNWDSEERQREVEKDGIVGEVIFPNTAPPFYPCNVLMAHAPRTRDELERRWAGLKAHNRWLKDFCDQVPGRRAGVAQIFLNDVDEAVREIEWVKNNGLHSVMLPSVDPSSGLAPLWANVYEPIFAAAEDLGIPLNHHAVGVGDSPEEFGDKGWAVNIFEVQFFASRGMHHLIYGGVFERHPNLKLAMTEQFLAWVPERLALLDGFYLQGRLPGTIVNQFCGPAFEELPMLPSEYFKRNCYMGASFLMPHETPLKDLIGIDRIMWGSDFPHGEGTWPYSREAIRASLWEVPVEENRKMLGENAIELFGLDYDKCRAAADIHGPTVGEIAQPLEDPPAFPDDSACLVFAPTGTGTWN